MRRWMVLAAALAAGACAGPQRFSAPAPQGALDCAVREARRMGFEPAEGRAAEGAVTVGMRIAPRGTEQMVDREERPGRVVTTNYAHVPWDGQLRFRQRRGMLLVEVVSERDLRGQPEGTGTTADQGRQILALCSTR